MNYEEKNHCSSHVVNAITFYTIFYNKFIFCKLSNRFLYDIYGPRKKKVKWNTHNFLLRKAEKLLLNL